VKAVEATAPCRVDLGGANLDLWPVYLFHPGALAVGVGIDRRAWARVETGVDGVHVESKDTLVKARAATVSELLGADPRSLVAHVLGALGVESGLRVVTQSRVPVGSGLGGPLAVAVAVAAAVCHTRGRAVDPDRLGPIVRDAEARSTGRPAGILAPHVALRGGALALHLEPGTARVEPLELDPARVEECLLLVDASASRVAGLDSWAVCKRRVEGDEETVRSLAKIAAVARGVREALLEGRFLDVVDLLGEEWEARKRLGSAVTTPEVDRVVETARAAGGAARACGPRGGGVVAVWAPPGGRGAGRREAVEHALTAAGVRVFPARVDLRGLELD